LARGKVYLELAETPAVRRNRRRRAHGVAKLPIIQQVIRCWYDAISHTFALPYPVASNSHSNHCRPAPLCVRSPAWREVSDSFISCDVRLRCGHSGHRDAAYRVLEPRRRILVARAGNGGFERPDCRSLPIAGMRDRARDRAPVAALDRPLERRADAGRLSLGGP